MASYPGLPGCITCGEIIETAVANTVDAKFDHIDSLSVSVKIIVLFVFGIVLFVRFGLF